MIKKAIIPLVLLILALLVAFLVGDDCDPREPDGPKPAGEPASTTVDLPVAPVPVVESTSGASETPSQESTSTGA